MASGLAFDCWCVRQPLPDSLPPDSPTLMAVVIAVAVADGFAGQCSSVCAPTQSSTLLLKVSHVNALCFCVHPQKNTLRLMRTASAVLA